MHQTKQIFRDPSLTAEGVYHDRIAADISPPELTDIAERERREENRHMRVFRTATEFFGQTRALEITYEPDMANPPSVVIHAITLVRRICGRGEYWYDQDGEFHEGPHYERTEVSGQLDAGQIQALGEEVIGYATAYRRGRN